jgi:hypothetical protein
MVRILLLSLAFLAVLGMSPNLYYSVVDDEEATEFSFTCSRLDTLPSAGAPTRPVPYHCQIFGDNNPVPNPASDTSPVTGITPD